MMRSFYFVYFIINLNKIVYLGKSYEMFIEKSLELTFCIRAILVFI